MYKDDLGSDCAAENPLFTKSFGTFNNGVDDGFFWVYNPPHPKQTGRDECPGFFVGAFFASGKWFLNIVKKEEIHRQQCFGRCVGHTKTENLRMSVYSIEYMTHSRFSVNFL